MICLSLPFLHLFNVFVLDFIHKLRISFTVIRNVEKRCTLHLTCMGTGLIASD